jgi:hypothetical protein
VIACYIRDSRFEVRGEPQYRDPFGVQLEQRLAFVRLTGFRIRGRLPASIR